MKIFGLLGRKLTHSFSKKYFSEKFVKENIKNCEYHLFEIPEASSFPEIITKFNPSGLNITIPYKQELIPYMDILDSRAERIGAINVIKTGKQLQGFNSDYFGFRESLVNWIKGSQFKALILGTGGASRAVKAVLEDLNINYLMVSRNPGLGITYEKLNENPELIKEHKLIINTTPLGTYPLTEEMPMLPYSFLDKGHYLYDLVYNPELTSFMKKGLEHGANVKNGLEMLQIQAEKSWEIWNS